MPYLRMRGTQGLFLIALAGMLIFVSSSLLRAQTGNSGTISGLVKDPSGAVVASADVQLSEPVSGFHRAATTGTAGNFSFPNVPFNTYRLSVNAAGFASYTKDVDLRSSVPMNLEVDLKIGAASTNVTVTENASDLLEVEPTDHTDVDRGLFNDLPLESVSSTLSSLITLSSPGVAADSNGLFHGLGDHAENSFSVDGQPITDQQSKVFSNQLPSDAIQSIEVIEGAPPAEFGDKTSLVIVATTRSGMGIKQPTGSVTASYGNFGTSNLGFDVAYGGDKWGNFIAANGLNTGRFLDGPEFTVLHDHGNEENVFDRVDFKLSNVDTLQVNFGYTRSWFQTPNSFDAQNATSWSGLVADNGGLGPDGLPVGPSDQRSQIGTFNIAPTWTRLINANTVFTLGAYVRHDQYNYYPSGNPFADLQPLGEYTPNLQSLSIGQNRKLTNAGFHADLSYVKGINNIKGGINYEHTLLTENDTFGIADPLFNPVCDNADGSINTSPSITNQSQCGGALNPGGSADPTFTPLLACYDLTRTAPLPAGECPNGQTRSSKYAYAPPTADIKELALFLQDTITKGNWTFNLGLRGDFYNGISSARQAEPRVGVAYRIAPTNTVLRASYANTMETPFNENLIISSLGCDDPVVNAINVVATGSCFTTPLSPGWRNEYHVGGQQAFGKHFVLDGEYIWKYTRNAYDFSIFGNTPITFPIEDYKSQIPGFAIHGTFPEYHGLSAYVVMSHVVARFFNPQISGIGATVGGAVGTPFRIDHDEVFNQTTHVQYQPWRRGPWFSFNWRYDSGLVAGAVPFPVDALGNAAGVGTPVDLSGLSPDQEFEAGLFCGSTHATPTVGLPSTCPNTVAVPYGSTLVSIPGTVAHPALEDDDTNPQRIAPRSLFDLSVGDDDLFRGDRYKWSARFTVINIANKQSLYNFLSTFSGTHYVTPRNVTGELGFHF